MKKLTRIVTHVDGKTKVQATGYINQQNEFVGQYRFEGMTYGITIPISRIDLIKKEGK